MYIIFYIRISISMHLRTILIEGIIIIITGMYYMYYRYV